MTAVERRERQDFDVEAACLMCDRFLTHEMWERLGIPDGDGLTASIHTPLLELLQRVLFAKITPHRRRSPVVAGAAPPARRGVRDHRLSAGSSADPTHMSLQRGDENTVVALADLAFGAYAAPTIPPAADHASRLACVTHSKSCSWS